MKTTGIVLLVAALSACANDTVTPGTRGDCEGVDCFVVEGPGAASTAPCARYLSCLLATQPAAYGAAIQLYGESSACWQSDAQRTGCNQACEASFDAIAGACACTGDSCAKCNAPEDGYYVRTSSPTFGACTAAELSTATLTTGANRLAELEFTDGFGNPVMLSGTLSCEGPSTLTGTRSGGGACTRTFSAKLDAQGDGRSILASITTTLSCQGSPPETCSGSVLLEK